MQGLCPESGLRTAPNWPEFRKMTMTSHFSDMTSTWTFLDVVLFLLSNLVTDRSFMSISSLVLELWQFFFIRDWPEIWKSEIPPSDFCSISGDWGELWVPNLARMSLIECYWMLQNSRVTAFTVLELLRENHLGGKIIPPPTQIRVKCFWRHVQMILFLDIYKLSLEQSRKLTEQNLIDIVSACYLGWKDKLNGV